MSFLAYQIETLCSENEVVPRLEASLSALNSMIQRISAFGFSALQSQYPETPNYTRGSLLELFAHLFLALPSMKAGAQSLVLTRPYDSTSNLEWLYLLGSFGFQVAGSIASISPLPKSLEFEDWTSQGFPFYAGIISYSCEFVVPKTTLNPSLPAKFALQVDTFKAPLLRVYIDDDEVGTPLAFAPYQIPSSSCDGTTLVTGSKHKLRIKTYGSRINAFGTLHNVSDDYFCFRPNAWRTKGAEWCYEYRIKQLEY